MKVETPQILWHALEDNGKPAALSSVSVLESGLDLDIHSHRKPTYVLATAAGTGTSIHLWKVELLANSNNKESSNNTNATASNVEEGTTTSTLPVPQEQQQQQQPEQAAKEAARMMFHPKSSFTKIEFMCSLNRHDGSVNQLKFSPDGLHLVSCSESGSVIIWSVPLNKRGNQNGRHFWSTLANENECKLFLLRSGDSLTSLSWSRDSQRVLLGSIDSNVLVAELNATTQEWKFVWRTKVHSHFVQGVAFDPTNVYLASQSSDRTVKIQMRKQPTTRNNKQSNKFEISLKAKQLKYRTIVAPTTTSTTTTTSLENAENTNEQQQQQQKAARMKDKSHLFCDESTLESFVRRLAWTTDGAYLICPSAMYQDKYATFVFARHMFEEPCCILGGLEKPSVAVSVNPLLFQLPQDGKENVSKDCKYRSVFGVLTRDSVLVYDTVSSRPLAVVKNLHYANLVDATWTPDGHALIVCSSDGYISILHFSKDELGPVYQQQEQEEMVPSVAALETAQSTTAVESTTTINISQAMITPPQAPTTVLPPCEPGTTSIECPPSKRPKTMTTTTTTTTTTVATKSKAEKRPATPPTDAVNGLSIDGNKKKKKRAQLVSMGMQQQ